MSSVAPTQHGHDDRLLISLAGVAELARVRRPVASVWRTRHRQAESPFPPAAVQHDGAEFFDADEVAAWLAATGHGNNPDAVADAATSAVPAEFDPADPDHDAELSALIALRALRGAPLTTASPGELLRTAREADASDAYLVTELDRHLGRPRGWLAYADRLVDACYSPADALERVQSRRTDRLGASAGRLEGLAAQLTARLCAALAAGGPSRVRLAGGPDVGLFRALVADIGEDVDVGWPEGDAGRALRRVAAVAGMNPVGDLADAATSRTVVVARFPVSAGTADEQVLSDVDAVAVELGPDDVAIVMAPARVLVDPLAAAAESARAASMRDGRVRAIVRLPAGLVATAAREALALWLLGPAVPAPLAERVTAVADLTDVRLTEAARADLVSDLLAVLTGSQAARAHAFRFARLVRTSSLLARRGALVSESTPERAARRNTRDLPALLDDVAARVGDDGVIPPIAAGDDPLSRPQTTRLDDAVAARHVRVLPGIRLAAGELGAEGLPVVMPVDLDDPGRIGEHRIDLLAFSAVHPSAQLTRPGDVVFRTSPTAQAWVDAAGSHAVAYPARVLRISTADPGGLVPEIVAADIRAARPGPGAWRRWRLRVIDPAQRESLRAALAALSAARDELHRRAVALGEYADLLGDAVAARAVMVTSSDPAADAASDSH